MDRLPPLEEWLAASHSERERVLESLAADLGHPWYCEGPTITLHESEVPLDLDDGEGAEDPDFVYIPPGTFRPGLSPTEQDALEQWLREAREPSGRRVADAEILQAEIASLVAASPWRPVIRIEPFLMSRLPFQLTPFARAAGLRASTDAEWEWALRAGTTTPFWHGDDPPHDPGFYDLELHEDPQRHPLDLLAMGWLEEECAGEHLPGDGAITYRGGAQDMSPWQGTGEVFVLLSAFRTDRCCGTPATRAVLPLSR